MAESNKANVRVLVRVRPLNDRESRFNPASSLLVDDRNSRPAATNGGNTSIDFSGGNGNPDGGAGGSSGTISLSDAALPGQASGYDSGNGGGGNGSAPRQFTYDAVFGPSSTQESIYQATKGIVDGVVGGYNGCVLAYGQTGSGKTHTVFGDIESGDGDSSNDAEAGLVQRSVAAIFEGVSRSAGSVRTSAKASFFEIYNERIYDLLNAPSDPSDADDRGLSVREDGSRGVYVEGLLEKPVADASGTMDVLRSGMSNRTVAMTNMNRASSRSHAVFVLTVKTEREEEASGLTKTRVAKFTLVDLAGSERQKSTSADGERLKEASMINGSLLTLGQVVGALADREQGRDRHVPFRDSKLTFLLRDCWGGNAKTCLVATVTPSVSSLSETVSTLKFAQRAKLVKNSAVLNEDATGGVAALRAEIARLRSELDARNGSPQEEDGGDRKPAALPANGVSSPGSGPAAVSALRSHNAKLVDKVKALKDQTTHREKQVNALKRKLQQETMVRKCKERRIESLSSKMAAGDPSAGGGGDTEASALRDEVRALREQLDGQPSESVEWMIKYKEEKARADELTAASDLVPLAARERDELESSLVSLLDERDALKGKIESMRSNTNGEIDRILVDVGRLEESNERLRSDLAGKDKEIAERVEEIRVREALEGVLTEQNEATARERDDERERAVRARETADRLEDDLILADAEMARMEGTNEFLQNDLERTCRLHEEEMARAEAARDGDLADRDEAIASLEAKLNGAKTAENEANTRSEELQDKVSTLREAAAEMEDGLQLADAEASLAARECESLRADIERTDRLHEVEMARAEASRDGDLADRDEAITSLEAKLSGSKTAENEANKRAEELQDKVSTLQEELASAKEHAANAEEGRCVAEQLLIGKQSEMHELESDYRLKEAELDEVTATVERTKSEKNEMEARLADLQGMEEKLVATEAAVEEGKVTIRTLETRNGEVESELEMARTDLAASEESNSALRAANVELEKTNEANRLSIENGEAEKGRLVAQVDDLKSAVDELVIELKAKKSEQEDLRKDHQATLKALEDAKAELKTANEGKASMSNQLDEKASDHDALVAEHETVTAALDGVKAELETANEDKGNLARQNDELQSSSEKISAELATLQEKLGAKTSDHEALVGEHGRTSDLLESTKTELAAATAEKKALSDQVNQYKSDAEDLAAVQGQLDAKVKEMEDTSKALEDTNARLVSITEDKCGLSAQVDELTRNLEEKAGELTSLREQLDSKTNECTALGNEHEKASAEFESTKAELDAAIQNEKSLSKQIDELKTSADGMSKTITALKEQLDGKTSEHEALVLEHETTSKMLETTRAYLDTATNDKEKLTAEIAALQCEPEAKQSETTSPDLSPIKSAAADTSPYEEEASFDEDDFLPNMSPEANPVPPEETAKMPSMDDAKCKIPETNESSCTGDHGADSNNNKPDESPLSPSKTPFKVKRAMFSPKREVETCDAAGSAEPSRKKIRTTPQESNTPVTRPKRATRSKASSSKRKPLGDLTTPRVRRSTRTRSSKQL